MKKLCVICGNDFEASRSSQTFCSAKCRVKHHRQAKRMMQGYVTNNREYCEYCGSKIRGSRRGRPKKYCSPSCRTMQYRKDKQLMTGE